MVERHIIANDGGFADHHPHAVVDEKASTDRRARVNLDAGQATGKVRDHAPAPIPLTNPEAVRQTMQDQRMNPRITGEHLPCRTRRRIAVKHGTDIFTQTTEHETGTPRRTGAGL